MAIRTHNPTPDVANLVCLVMNPERPAAVRAKILLDVIAGSLGDPKRAQEVTERFLAEIIKQGASAQTEAARQEAEAIKAKYTQALEKLTQGPPRVATFVGPADPDLPGTERRAHVITPDGQERYPLLTEKVRMEDMTLGMSVFLDAEGVIVLGFSSSMPEVGEQATFLRRMPETNCIEVRYTDHPIVLYAAQPVLDALDAAEAGDGDGAISHGDSVLFCPRRRVAFDVIPSDDDREYRFVDTAKIPEVIPGRDIGSPNPILYWLMNRLRTVLHDSDVLERFGLSPRTNVFLTGRTGTGKTLTIRAFLYHFSQTLKEFTGREDLSSRVIRFKAGDLLSEWFGRTEKNLDSLFDDIQALAGEEVEFSDGRSGRLPVVVVFEEAEGLARRRGGNDSGPYDRIIGTLLQRLDDPTENLNQLPVFWITTSNRPDMLDSAMWRRLSGKRAHFGHLDQEGVIAVLGKKLKPDFPYASDNGASAGQARQAVIDQTVMSLFSPNGEDKGQIEITMRDGQKLIKYRRDFVTGAILDTGVANAVDRTVFAIDSDGGKGASLTPACVIEAIAEVTDSLADNLTMHNALDYVDLPDHTSVASVRRLRQTTGKRLHRMAQ